MSIKDKILLNKYNLLILLVVISLGGCLKNDVEVAPSCFIFEQSKDMRWFEHTQIDSIYVLPTVMGTLDCNEYLIIVQKPSLKDIGNVLLMQKHFYDKDSHVVNNEIQIQKEIISSHKSLNKAYSLDIAYWIYDIIKTKLMGPYTYIELKNKIECDVHDINMQNRY